MSAQDQIDKLACFILNNYSDYVIGGGAGDVAIRIIKDLQRQLDELLSKEQEETTIDQR